MSTEPKWTKGPWFVDGSGIKACVRDYANRLIVSVRHRIRGEQHEANAHLIAAAPELYEALAAIVDSNARRLPIQAYQIRNAKSALAKARGES